MSSNSAKTEVRCPACHKISQVQHGFVTPSGIPLVYYLCNCGTIWHEEKISEKIFGDDYVKRFRETKFFSDKINQIRRTYLPIIEEQMYGRESLDIGFCFPENIIDMRERGWLADGIDVIKNDYLTGDFETFDFKGRQYDLIIMNHVLASMKKPLEALKKASGLLRGGGLLLLAAPDTNLCLSVKYSQFGHWFHENKTMFSMERTIQELVKCGMEKTPLVSVQNISKRFMYSNDMHLIMRKEIPSGL